MPEGQVSKVGFAQAPPFAPETSLAVTREAVEAEAADADALEA